MDRSFLAQLSGAHRQTLVPGKVPEMDKYQCSFAQQTTAVDPLYAKPCVKDMVANKTFTT